MACPDQMSYAHGDKLGSKFNGIGLDTIYGICHSNIWEEYSQPIQKNIITEVYL